LNLSFFIARKVASAGQRSFARLIIRIAMVAVAVSVAVMILATALVTGFKTEISEKMFGFWGHIHITSNIVSTSYEPMPIEQTPDFLKKLTDILSFTDDNGLTVPFKGIQHVQVYATKAGIIKTKDNFEGIVLKGVGADYDWMFLNQHLEAGKKIDLQDAQDDTLSIPDILISQSTANRLNLKVGSRLVIHFVKNNAQQQQRFEVSGIYKTGLEEYDKKFALVPLSTIQRLLGWSSNQVAGFEVFSKDLSVLPQLNEHLYRQILPPNWLSQTIREEQPSIFQWLDLQDINEWVILALMAVVCIINMITALLILILERTNMIGILKSLGATDRTVQGVFMYYAAIILGLAWLQKVFKIIRMPEADYYLSVAPIHLDFWVIAALNVATLGFTLLVLWLPSMLVFRITPVSAIRFK
jgi:lipoprotein-releasing system permease protein